MTLAEIITALEAEDPRKVLPQGFNSPHSYRGYYDELAFEPARNVTVADMLKDARSALGNTYQGYKGGDYVMSDDTDCWLAHYGTAAGESIGPLLLRLMLAAGTVPDGSDPVTPTMREITDAVVLKYIAESAESIIEDDLNESGDWTDEEHKELVRRAFEWIGEHR